MGDVMSADILDLDATGQLAALTARKISAVELLGLVRAREAREHDRLNLVVSSDPARAEAEARATDAARARGEALGPLAGLPMTLKDTFDLEGLPGTSGLAVFKDRPCADAVAVAKARAAGAVIWGKTNVPVMAGDWQSYNDLYGTSNNPWDVTRTTGGSSGGAAGALATGVTALEIGSDIGGSLRVPANFCGVYSHKPTWAAVSQVGHVPPVPGTRAQRDLNVIGPMARSARDLKLLFDIIAEAPARPSDLPARPRIGLWLDEPAFPLDPQSHAVIEAYAKQLQGLADIAPITSPTDMDALFGAYRGLLAAVLGTDLPPEQQAQFQALRPHALQNADDPAMQMVLGYTATHAEWLAMNEVRVRAREAVTAAFAGYDLILAPITPVPAFPHDHRPFNDRTLTLSSGETIPYVSMMGWISLATACGLPATCVPAGLTTGGLPVGVQLIGPPHADGRTLAAARLFEQVRGFVKPPGI
jgi:amidase